MAPALTAVCIEQMPQPTKAVFLKSLSVSKLIGILSFLKASHQNDVVQAVGPVIVGKVKDVVASANALKRLTPRAAAGFLKSLKDTEARREERRERGRDQGPRVI